MAQILPTGQVKKDNGQIITPKTGEWYDSQQYWGGTLSNPGQINSLSNQQGAGQAVSAEVVAQTNKAQGLAPGTNEAYIARQQNKSTAPSAVPTTPSPVLAPGGAVTPSTPGGMSAGIATTPTINLPEIYQSLYDTSGISALEKELSDKEKQFIEVQGGINDNPFLSEATRLGRVAKAQALYDQRTASLKNDIATKKADIETKLSLQTKQFDINSQQAKDNLSQLNTLISLGALDNASGETIANLTRSTGISSDMIQSAIKARTKKEAETQVITSTADNGVVTVSVINKNTGEVINQNSLGAIGNKQTGSSTGSTYGGTSDKYLKDASDILAKAEVAGQTAGIDGKKEGDQYISKEEAQQARNQIIALVGDEKLGSEIFERAFNTGGYKPWNW